MSEQDTLNQLYAEMGSRWTRLSGLIDPNTDSDLNGAPICTIFIKMGTDPVLVYIKNRIGASGWDLLKTGGSSPSVPRPLAYWKFDDGPWAHGDSVLDTMGSYNLYTNATSVDITTPIINGGSSACLFTGSGFSDYGIGTKSGITVPFPAFSKFTFQIWATVYDIAALPLLRIRDSSFREYLQVVTTSTGFPPWPTTLIWSFLTMGTYKYQNLFLPKSYVAITWDGTIDPLFSRITYYTTDPTGLLLQKYTHDCPVPSGYSSSLPADIFMDIGGFYFGIKNWYISIDECAIWDEVLTDDNINYIWDGNTGRTIPV